MRRQKTELGPSSREVNKKRKNSKRSDFGSRRVDVQGYYHDNGKVMTGEAFKNIVK